MTEDDVRDLEALDYLDRCRQAREAVAAATVTRDRHFRTQMTMTQAAAEQLLRDKRITFGGITIMLVEDTPVLVKRHGYYQSPVRLFEEG